MLGDGAGKDGGSAKTSYRCRLSKSGSSSRLVSGRSILSTLTRFLGGSGFPALVSGADLDLRVDTMVENVYVKGFEGVSLV
jgi:hypothetical protein